MPSYTVQQGDHLSSIAEQFGFQKIDTIWNHASNAELKKLRKDPHILFPGDVVFVPDKADKSAPASTTKVNKFEIEITKLKLNLKFQDVNGDALSNLPVAISLEGQNIPPFVTDDAGKTVSEIKKSAHDGLLLIQDLELQFRVGHLDPVDQQSGQIARLNNLGYEAGDTGTVDVDAFKSAVEEFQCDQKLPVNGNCDGATQAKLKEVHGC